VIHALWWWLRRRAESSLVPAFGRRSAAVAIRPARCAGELAAVERLLGEWHAASTAFVAAELRILGIAVLAFSGQSDAEDREQGGGNAWAGDSTATGAYSLAARDIADPPPARDPVGRVTALAPGVGEWHGGLTVRERTGSEMPRR
jgi:hypothetical protein